MTCKKGREEIDESDRNSPRQLRLGSKDCVSLAVPEPEVLRVIGKESKRKGTNRLGSRQINRIIKDVRGSKRQ